MNRRIGSQFGGPRLGALLWRHLVAVAWVALLVAGPPEAEAQEEGGASAVSTIDDVKMTCDLKQCENPVQIDRYLEIAGLYPGAEWTKQRKNIARERLRKTGLFKEVNFDKSTSATGGVAVRVEAVGAVRVRDIDFKGVSPPPFRSDLRKLLMYRQGEAYENDLTKKNAQVRSLEEAFAEEGFFGTSIEMSAARVGEDRKLVDIAFRIDKGKRLKICDLGIRGLRTLSYSEARRQLFSEMPLLRRFEMLSPRYTTDAFEAGQEALVQQYRQSGFFRARIVDEDVKKRVDEGCVTVLLDIEEGPRWDVKFEGNDIVGRQALKKELPFYESGYVDAEEIERAERAIRQLYETRGHPFTSVDGREEREDRLNRRLVFTIDEGDRLEIDELVFHGNSALSDAELARGLGTRPYELFGAGGFLQTAQLLGDIRRIEERYRKRGYLRAEVARYEIEVDREDGTLTVHLYIDERNKVVAEDVRFGGVRSLTRARLNRNVNIRAGDPFVPVQLKADESRIGQLYSSVGYPLASVSTSCRLSDGRRVDCKAPRRPASCVATTVEDIDARCDWDEGRTRKVCQRIGSIDSDQEPDSPSTREEDPGDRAAAGQGRRRTETSARGDDKQSQPSCDFDGGIGAAQKVGVDHEIDEGPFVSTGEFLIQGNFRTKDSIIRRELPLGPGDIFDVRKILEGQSNLRSLGIFDSVSVEAIGLDDEAAEDREHDAALLVSVEESTTRFFEVKGGLEWRNVLREQQKLLTTAEVEYQDKNVFGRALQLRPHVFGALDGLQIGERLQGAAGQLDYLLGAELVFRHPRFLKGALDVDKLYLTVTPFYLIDLLGVVNDQLLREEWGLRLEVRKELSEIMDRLFFSFGLEGKQAATAPVSGPRLGGDRIFSPRRTTGKLIPKLTLDRRDSPLNPTEGYFVKFKPEYVTGDALSPQISTFEDSYFRLTFNGSVFWPLGEQLVLGQNFKFGQVLPVSGRSSRVPADERYFMGGAGSVRGFPNNSLGPTVEDQPTGGEMILNYNLELRYPLVPGGELQGATFFDAGVLVDCFDDDNPNQRTNCYEDAFFDPANPTDKIRTSAGVGIRYVIGGQVPLLLDWGMALDRQHGEGFGNLQFQLGYTF